MGKEFNNEPMDGLFAGTPPLEALRYLIHEAATVRPQGPMGIKVGLGPSGTNKSCPKNELKEQKTMSKLNGPIRFFDLEFKNQVSKHKSHRLISES